MVLPIQVHVKVVGRIAAPTLSGIKGSGPSVYVSLYMLGGM